MQYHQAPFNFTANGSSSSSNNNHSDPPRSRPGPPTEPPGLTSGNARFPPPGGLRSSHHPLNFILPGPPSGGGPSLREDTTGKPTKKRRPNRKSFHSTQEPPSGMMTSTTSHPNGRVPNMELIATLTRHHPPGGSTREPNHPRPSETDHQPQPNGSPEENREPNHNRDTLTPLPNLNPTRPMEPHFHPNYTKLGEPHQTTSTTNGSTPHRTSNHKRKGSFKIPPTAIPPFTQLGVEFPKFQPSHRKRNSELVNYRKLPTFHRGHTQSLDKNPFPLNASLPRPRELPNHPPTQVKRPPPELKSESQPLGHAFTSKKVGNKEVFVFNLPPPASQPEWDPLDSPRKDSTSSSHSSTTRDITELQHIWTSHTTPGSVASAKGVHTKPIPRTRCLSGPGKLHAWQSLHGPEVSPRFNTPLYPYLEPSAPHPTQLGRPPRLDKSRPKFERVQNWLSNQPRGPPSDSGSFTGVHPPTPTKPHVGAGAYHSTSGESMVTFLRGPPDTPSDPQLGQDAEVYIGDFFNSPGPNLELLMDSPVPAAAELVAISHHRQRLQSGGGNHSTSSPVPMRCPPFHSSDGSHPDPSPGSHRVSTSHPQGKRPPPATKALCPPTPESNDHVAPQVASHPSPRGEGTQVPSNPSEFQGQPKKPTAFTHRKSYTPRPPTPEGDPTAEPAPSHPPRKSPPFQARPPTPELDQVVPGVVKPSTIVQLPQPRPPTPEGDPRVENPPIIQSSPKSNSFPPRSPEPISSTPVTEVAPTTTTQPPRKQAPFQARPLTPEEDTPVEKLPRQPEPRKVRPPTPEADVVNPVEIARDPPGQPPPKVSKASHRTEPFKVCPPTPEDGGGRPVEKASVKPGKKPSKASQPSHQMENFKVRPPTPDEDPPANPKSKVTKSKVRPPTPKGEATHPDTSIPGNGIQLRLSPPATATPSHGKRPESVAPPHHQKKRGDLHDLAIPDQNISPLILNETHHHTTPASPPGSMTLPSQPPDAPTHPEVKIRTKLRYTGQEFVPRGLPRPPAPYPSGSSSPAGHLSPPSDGSYGGTFYPLSPGYPQGYQKRLPTSPPAQFPSRSPSYHGSPPGNRQQVPLNHHKFTNGHRNKGGRPNDYRRREETPPGSPTQFTLNDFPPLGSPSEALKPTRVAHPSPRSKATKIKYTAFDQHVDHLVHQATSHPNAPTHYRYPGTVSPRPTQSQPGRRSPAEVHPTNPRRPQTDPNHRQGPQPPISEAKAAPVHPPKSHPNLEVNPGVTPLPPTQSSVKDEITRPVPKGVTPTHPEPTRDETTLGLGLDFRASSPPPPEPSKPNHPHEKKVKGHQEGVHPHEATEEVVEKPMRVSDPQGSTGKVPHDQHPPHPRHQLDNVPGAPSAEDPVTRSEFAEVVTVWDSPPEPDLKFTIELAPPPTLPPPRDDHEASASDVMAADPPVENVVEPVKVKEVPEKVKVEEFMKMKEESMKVKDHVKGTEEPVKVKERVKEESVKTKKEPAKVVKPRVTKLEVEVDRFDFLNLREPQEFTHLEGDFLSPNLNPWVTKETVPAPTPTPPLTRWEDPTRGDPDWGLAIAVSNPDQVKVTTPTPTSPPPAPPTPRVLARHCFDTPQGPRKLIWYQGTHPWEVVATFCQRYSITNPQYLQALVHYLLHPPSPTTQ